MTRLYLSALACLALSACAHEEQAPDRDMGENTQTLSSQAQSDLYLGVVDGLIRQERYEAAIAFLAKYQKSAPLIPRYHKLAGDALAGAGRTEEALSAYRLALNSDLAASAYNGMGRALSAKERWVEAAENFHQAAMLDPANAIYLNNFGYAQLKQDYRGPALAPVVSEFKRAHELDPASSLIRNNLALALKLAGRENELQALLDTIPAADRRTQVAEFSVAWTPNWSNDTDLKNTDLKNTSLKGETP